MTIYQGNIVLRVICCLVAATLSSCSAMSRSNGSLLPSELVRNASKYDGKHMVVRGFVVIGPESRSIFDSNDGVEDPDAACLGLGGPDEMFREFHIRYTSKLSGFFRQRMCGKDDICLMYCGTAGIDLDEGSKP
jgi:hypothetical protein